VAQGAVVLNRERPQHAPDTTQPGLQQSQQRVAAAASG